MNHADGLDGEDVGLHRFEPKSFYLLGGNLSGLGKGEVKTVGEILTTADPARPGLLRVNNANYMPTVIRFGGGLVAEVIAHDGRALRDTTVKPSPPVSLHTDRLGFGAAERYDMRLRPPAGAKPGDLFSVTVEWQHWITGRVIGQRTAPVRVL